MIWMARHDPDTHWMGGERQVSGVFLRPTYADDAVAVFNALYPDRLVPIAFFPAKQCVGDGGEPAQGFTLFPDDDPANPEIWISDETPVYGVPDVIFHELAHVVAGFDADHGPQWEAVYDALWARFAPRGIETRQGGDGTAPSRSDDSPSATRRAGNYPINTTDHTQGE
ncbi:MAG TPA: hypothetical protein VF638_00785 [Sphingomonas sp.]|jgi:hypothetical protein